MATPRQRFTFTKDQMDIFMSVEPGDHGLVILTIDSPVATMTFTIARDAAERVGRAMLAAIAEDGP
jgi:hypothetical protein